MFSKDIYFPPTHNFFHVFNAFLKSILTLKKGNGFLIFQQCLNYNMCDVICIEGLDKYVYYMICITDLYYYFTV